MVNLGDLTAWRDTQRALRASGKRSCAYDGRSVSYASDAELAAALADLDRQIAAASGTRITRIRISTSKGL